jgi:hypothetical protein
VFPFLKIKDSGRCMRRPGECGAAASVRRSTGLPSSVRVLLATAVALLMSCPHGTMSAQNTGKIARPVDSALSFESSTFQADYDRVWDLLSKILTDDGFDLTTKDRKLGRIETGYVTFSRNPRLSRLKSGVKSLAKTPRLFLRKWVDGKMKVLAEVHRLSQDSTEIVLRPDIYGFACTLADDSSVSGEWRQCNSNGKFEFELFNQLATLLGEKESAIPPKVRQDPEPAELTSVPTTRLEGSSALVLDSVPDGAEILLDNRLVGMTPSRLTVSPGSHKVVFRKKGYKGYEREFVILKDTALTIATEMEEQ